MQGVDVFNFEPIKPLESFGLTHPFFNINATTVFNTWAAMGLLFVIILWARASMRKKNSIGQYVVLSFVRGFKDLGVQALGTFNYAHFAMITALFIFILLCNWISIIPWLEEPTRDLNTTLALGLISFLYSQGNAIGTHGFKEYIKDYFAPFILMFPLNVIGNLATIVSISFRLFGNIFGGSIIAQLYTQTISGVFIWESLGILSGINISITLFFGLFEGFIQAFVFAMLSLTYLSMAVAPKTIEGT